MNAPNRQPKHHDYLKSAAVQPTAIAARDAPRRSCTLPSRYCAWRSPQEQAAHAGWRTQALHAASAPAAPCLSRARAGRRPESPSPHSCSLQRGCELRQRRFLRQGREVLRNRNIFGSGRRNKSCISSADQRRVENLRPKRRRVEQIPYTASCSIPCAAALGNASGGTVAFNTDAQRATTSRGVLLFYSIRTRHRWAKSPLPAKAAPLMQKKHAACLPRLRGANRVHFGNLGGAGVGAGANYMIHRGPSAGGCGAFKF